MQLFTLGGGQTQTRVRSRTGQDGNTSVTSIRRNNSSFVCNRVSVCNNPAGCSVKQAANPLGNYFLLKMKEGRAGVKNTEAGSGVASTLL